MKNYNIKVNIEVTAKKDYSDEKIGYSEINKSFLCPASKLKEEVTKVVRNAVAHFSESVTAGLTPLIQEEPKLEAPKEQEALTV